jgi:hypothetical protein
MSTEWGTPFAVSPFFSFNDLCSNGIAKLPGAGRNLTPGDSRPQHSAQASDLQRIERRIPTIMGNDGHTTLLFQVEPALIPPCFTPLFSRGVQVSACLECSLKELMCQQIGLAEDYLENRVQTVFLNGHPVDDVKQATVGEGAIVALSAAMPGLAGAVLRKGGVLATLRKNITYRNDASARETCEGKVIVKLFNMTTREVGPLLLARGIWMEGAELRELLDRCEDPFKKGCRRVILGNNPIGLEDLKSRIKGNDTLFLKVVTEGTSKK